MELPGVGSQCSVASCRQLDFLPFLCRACNQKFCAEHRVQTSHACAGAPLVASALVAVCPLCDAAFPLEAGETSPDATVNAHIERGCPARDRLPTINKYRCSEPGCKKRAAIELKCAVCGKSYCIPHRLQYDHTCSGPPAPAAPPARAAGEKRKCAIQ